VIPRSMVETERAHRGVTELVVIETMHERKQIMADRAGAFLALPGGVGTLDEIFEAITWNQLAIHDKPIGFLDLNGFYAPLKAYLDHAHAGGFIPAETMSHISFDPDPASALASIGIRTI
ncbi:MAG: TIGR00730 family Rossman fold protein, partial [Phycisphaerales bacterium]|nr:TIGR00730 family Rossman fold protein [Phycisphaerales bacterium]